MEAKTEIYWLKETSLMRSVVLIHHQTVSPLFAASCGLSSVSNIVGPSSCFERDIIQSDSEAKTQTQDVVANQPFVTSQIAHNMLEHPLYEKQSKMLNYNM